MITDFTEFYTSKYYLVQYYIRKVLTYHTPEQIEDAVQDVFVRVWKHWHTTTFPDEAHQMKWLSRIARNIALDLVSTRYTRNYEPLPLDDAPDCYAPESVEETALCRDAIQQMWQALNPRQRRSLSFLLQGHTLHELTEQEHGNYYTIARHVETARKAARRHYERATQ